MWCFGWRDNRRSLCYCRSWEFDVGTATTLFNTWTCCGTDTAGGDTVVQKDGSGLAAAAIAVCPGAVLRVPGCAGDDSAMVDADMGPERVHPGPALAGGDTA